MPGKTIFPIVLVVLLFQVIFFLFFFVQLSSEHVFHCILSSVTDSKEYFFSGYLIHNQNPHRKKSYNFDY